MAPWPRALVIPQLVDHKNAGTIDDVVLVLDQLKGVLTSDIYDDDFGSHLATEIGYNSPLPFSREFRMQFPVAIRQHVKVQLEKESAHSMIPLYIFPVTLWCFNKYLVSIETNKLE
ncbi:hypothetical protein TNCV_2890331 [Trichonephila clavipes]|nr:hypothetical protein TNCV_2890331 [Trichonephila clavipes]